MTSNLELAPQHLPRITESYRCKNDKQESIRLQRSISSAIPPPSAATINPQSTTPIPRSQRRGLLAVLTLVPEIDNSKTYPASTKWILTSIVAAAATAGPMGSAIVLPVLVDIERAFDTDAFTANLSVGVYMFAMALFPLYWSSFSETLGRRTIYLSSFALYIVFSILCAESKSIGMLIACRVFAGGASASVQAVGAGTIADVWAIKERGTAMGVFYLGPLCGPLLGPIVGGALGQGLGWRSTLWFLVIYGIVIWLLILLFLPETLPRPRPVQQAAAVAEKAVPQTLTVSVTTTLKHRTQRYTTLLHRSFIEPLSILLNMRTAAVALTVYFSSISFGVLYTLNIAIQKTFSSPPYSFSTTIVGLLYIPSSLGYLLASVLGGKWIDHIMHREARLANRHTPTGDLVFKPEDRMRENAWLGAVMFPLALIWFGWTAERGVFWVVPVIANFFFGVGTMLVVGPVVTMLTEIMPDRASHGIALNNFARNTLAGVGTLVAEPWIKALGTGWVFTILGIWTLASGPVVIWLIKVYGLRKTKSEVYGGGSC